MFQRFRSRPKIHLYVDERKTGQEHWEDSLWRRAMPTPETWAFQSVYGGKLYESVHGVDKTSCLPLYKREEDWSRNVSRNCIWDRYRWGTGQFSLVTVPEVFAEVDSAQSPSKVANFHFDFTGISCIATDWMAKWLPNGLLRECKSWIVDCE